MEDKSGKSFYDYFKENMNALGLPAPESLFGKLGTATASIAAMSAYINTYGTSATVSEMIFTLKGGSIAVGCGIAGASAAASEVVFVIGGLAVAFCVGACIGSLAVATGKYLSGGISISDCLSTADSYGFRSHGWLANTLTMNPGILKAGKKVRHFSTGFKRKYEYSNQCLSSNSPCRFKKGQTRSGKN